MTTDHHRPPLGKGFELGRTTTRPLARLGAAAMGVLAVIGGASAASADARSGADADRAATVEDLRLRVEQLERRLDGADAAAPAPDDEHGDRDANEESEHERPSVFELRLSGYGDLQFAFHDFGPNQNREGGSQDDRRLVFDDARFVFAVEATMPFGIEFEGEVEFEHGGVAVAQELEYEEFGEYELEVEKGGEVLLEEFYIKKTFGERYSIALGRFYVGMGLLSDYHLPTDYLATSRPEAEVSVIPAVWDELGLQVQARFSWLHLTAQLVNGLDSTAFSSQSWVASGHQSRFELVRATDLAAVARVDFVPQDDVVLGLSAYYGSTTRNRPKPDLVRECAGGDPDVVAPCGYLDAPLLLLDAHAHFQWGPVRGSALVLWGHLENADDISSRNERLSNALNVLRTPVADEALAIWAELGLDVAPWLGLRAAHRLEPFVRLDHYDTMFAIREGLFDNPRFERTVLTAGVAYAVLDALVLKLDASHRWFGSAALNQENSVRLSAGFVY